MPKLSERVASVVRLVSGFSAFSYFRGLDPDLTKRIGGNTSGISGVSVFVGEASRLVNRNDASEKIGIIQFFYLFRRSCISGS